MPILGASLLADDGANGENKGLSQTLHASASARRAVLCDVDTEADENSGANAAAAAVAAADEADDVRVEDADAEREKVLESRTCRIKGT